MPRFCNYRVANLSLSFSISVQCFTVRGEKLTFVSKQIAQIVSDPTRCGRSSQTDVSGLKTTEYCCDSGGTTEAKKASKVDLN